MALHRIALPGRSLEEGTPIVIEDEEAHHAARVKRLDVGDPVQVLDCAGGIARCVITRREKASRRGGWILEVVPEQVQRVPAIVPHIEVFSEPPKGHELERMVDQLSQLGAASWSPLACHRSEIEPRSGKLHRLSRIAVESSKQSGRAWAMQIGRRASFAEACSAPADTRVVVCHMSGQRFVGDASERVRLLIGPVGDLTEGELHAAQDHGATIASFGPLTMRIETACSCACAIVMDSQRAPPPT